METSHSISQHQNNKQECGSIGRRVLSLLPSYSDWLQCSLSLRQNRLSVIRGYHVGKSLDLAFEQLVSSNRFLVGFVLMVGVAPFFWMVYSLCDPNVIIEGFYYKAPFFWLYTNREELMIVGFLSGFFLFCPSSKEWDIKYLLIVPVSLFIIEIIYQSFFTNSWDDFFNIPNWKTWALSPVIVLAAWKFIQWLIYIKTHRGDAHKARLANIYNQSHLLTKEQIADAFLKTYGEMRATNY